MIPPMMDKKPIVPQEGPSNLEIAKQIFDEEMKKMRVKSRKQQEETERWKEQAKMHEGQLCGMSTDYGKAKEDKKRLNEEINVLERKFKYTGLRTSLGLPQDEQEKMQREVCLCKRQADKAQKKVTQLESAARAKDARHLEEIEKLRAIARNEHESLEVMIQTLEQQLQQQKDRTDRFIADWQNWEDEWRHKCQEIRTSRDQREAGNENRKVYIRFLADRFRETAQEAQEIVDRVERLISTTSPFGGHRAQLVSFLEQARGQYGQIVRFYEANHAMLNYF